MKALVKNLDNKEVGSIELSEIVFGVEPRRDLISRMINWQLAKRRSGNHKTKGISDVRGTTKKSHAQKGTGAARQGSRRNPHMRGGSVVFGPVVRDHSHSLPKKVRLAALRMALSSKLADGKLVIIDEAKAADHKTKPMHAKLSGMELKSALFIDGSNLDENFAKAVRNIPLIDVLPEQGANVYDILRRDTLVMTKNAVEQLQERLK